MSGTAAGGSKAVITNKAKYGEDFYKRIGKKGGSVCGTRGGFASNIVGPDGLTGPQRAKIAGRKGGRKSRKGKSAGYEE